MHVIRRRRSQKDRCTGDIFGMTPTAGRNTLENGFVAGGIRAQRLGIVGFDVTGRDGIHIDALRSPLIRQKLGETGNAMFRRRVGRDANAALKRQERGDIDHLAGPTFCQ